MEISSALPIAASGVSQNLGTDGQQRQFAAVTGEKTQTQIAAQPAEETSLTNNLEDEGSVLGSGTDGRGKLVDVKV